MPVINISLIGNTNVGKTALMNYFCRKPLDDKDKKMTIGVELEPMWVEIYS